MKSLIYIASTNGLLYFFASLTISAVFTRLCILLLPLFGMVDIPRGRHQHERIVPRGGGLAIIVSFLVTLGFYVVLESESVANICSNPLIWQFIPPVLVMMILGVLDDKFELRSFVKLLVHIAIALWFFYTGVGINILLGVNLPVYIALPLTVFWVIGIINAFNLIDGMDGVAAGLASISAFTMGIWMLIYNSTEVMQLICLMIFCGSCLGFLKYNFSPARIFMGDTGSMFIGMFFAYFSMLESSKAATVTSLLVPILAMGVPIFDVFLAISRRLIRKYIKKDPEVGLMTGDHDHLHHRINEQTGNQRKTVYILYGFAVLLAVGGLFASIVSDVMRSLSFAVLLVVIFVVVRCATIEFHDAAQIISDGIRIPRRSFLLTALHPVIDIVLLFAAYFFTSKIFSDIPNREVWKLHQIFIYIAPYPLVLAFSGVYRTYWLRVGIYRYYKLIRMLFLAAVIVLALAVIYVFYVLGYCRADFFMIREFYVVYVLLGTVLILFERFFLHYMESYSFNNLASVVAVETKQKLPVTLLYGGGVKCRLFTVQNNCATSKRTERKLIGMIDDNPALYGLNVYGLNVLGSYSDLEKLYKKHQFDELVITTDICEEKRNGLREFGRKNNVRISEYDCTLTEI